MYNSGNSSKNVTGASIVDGTVETVDIADDAVTADKLANSVNTDIATGVSGSTTAGDALPKAGGAMTGAITTNSTFDGRDVATDGDKLDLIEAAADVTDTANVTASGALMDSEVTNLADVKAFDTTDYATSTQGTTADNALPKTGGTLTVGGTAGIATALSVAATGNGGTGRGVAISLKPSGTSPGTPSVLAAQIVGLQESASATANNASLAFKVADTGGTLQERMIIDNSGNVLFNCTSLPTGGTDAMAYQNTGDDALLIDSAGTGASYNIKFFNANGLVGSILTSGTATSYNTSSDYRLKENVVPMTGSIDRLKALKPSKFNFKADTETSVDGFLAHEAQAVVPECVHGTKDGMKDEEYEVTPAELDADGNVITEAVMGTRTVPDYQGIDQSKIVPLLVAALQEAIARIEVLETP